MEPAVIAAEPFKFLGESIGFWIQTGAFFLSAIGAIAVIYYNGKQARVSALVAILTQQQSNQELLLANKLVNELHESGGVWAQHMGKTSPERAAILKVLNNAEFIAVGVRMKAFDEGVYKEIHCSTVLRLWSSSCGFIHELRNRTGKTTLFQDFERLATRWAKSPIKKI